MTSYEIVSVVFGSLGLVGGLIGFFYARAANKKAEKAQEVAGDALKRSATANEEAAVALKRANEIREAQLPVDEVRWAYAHVSGVLYTLTNVGTHTALNAVITDIGDPRGFIRPSEEARDIKPGDSIEFRVVSAWGAPRPEFRVTWNEKGTGKAFTDDTRMILRS